MNPAFIIAEIGHNHQGNLETCKRLFREAKAAGCDAVKLQKRENKRIFTEKMYNSPYTGRNAYAPTYGKHREKLEFTRGDYEILKEYAKELDIIFFATPFDKWSASMLWEMDFPMYKISSCDITNTPLLVHVASFGRPMIISTGGATYKDVDRAVQLLTGRGVEFTVMQCTSEYPCPPEHVNLKVIETYKQRYPHCEIGYSGHDNGYAIPLMAYMMGATVIEKHFTLDRSMKGTDHPLSLNPDMMRRMVRDLRKAQKALGDGIKTVYEEEKAAMRKRWKHLVALEDIPEGTELRGKYLGPQINGDEGLAPYHLDDFVGKTLKRALKKGEAISFNDI